jgi:2-haloacid dehalogenase
MTPHIKVIIFDYGNVLLEWNPRYVYQKYFPNDPDGMEDFLEEVDFMNWNAQQDKGRSFAEGVAVLSEKFPHYAQLIRAYHDNWIDETIKAGWISNLRLEQLVR